MRICEDLLRQASVTESVEEQQEHEVRPKKGRKRGNATAYRFAAVAAALFPSLPSLL